jgi:hypothetical protein
MPVALEVAVCPDHPEVGGDVELAGLVVLDDVARRQVPVLRRKPLAAFEIEVRERPRSQRGAVLEDAENVPRGGSAWTRCSPST